MKKFFNAFPTRRQNEQLSLASVTLDNVCVKEGAYKMASVCPGSNVMAQGNISANKKLNCTLYVILYMDYCSAKKITNFCVLGKKTITRI